MRVVQELYGSAQDFLEDDTYVDRSDRLSMQLIKMFHAGMAPSCCKRVEDTFKAHGDIRILFVFLWFFLCFFIIQEIQHTYNLIGF